VVYVYGIDDPDYHKFAQDHPDVTFTPFLDENSLESDTLLIIDDMHQSLNGPLNNFIVNFSTRSVHHNRISLIMVLHNMFSPKMRTSCLSSDYVLLFNFIRDRSTVSHIAKQCCPGQNQFLREAYDIATLNKKYGYLFFDLHQLQNPRLRFRSSIFNDPNTLLFVPT
jgi:hypothetical protein